MSYGFLFYEWIFGDKYFLFLFETHMIGRYITGTIFIFTVGVV